MGSVGLCTGLAVLVQVGACMGSNLLLRRTILNILYVLHTYYVSRGLEGSMKLAYSQFFNLDFWCLLMRAMFFKIIIGLTFTKFTFSILGKIILVNVKVCCQILILQDNFIHMSNFMFIFLAFMRRQN